MQRLYYILLCIVGITISAKAQQVKIPTSGTFVSVEDVVTFFKDQHNLQFSYDVAQMQQAFIPINDTTLSIEDFTEVLKTIAITLKKDKKGNYFLIQSNEENSYCVTIKDTHSNLALPNVTIYNGDEYLGITDFSGTANLEIRPGTLLTYRYTGYKSVIQHVSLSNDCITLMLKDDVQALEEIILTNYLTRGLVKNKNSSLTLSPKTLAILPGLVEPDVFQSLQLVPGINSPGENPASLHIRGGTPDQNLLLWDGIKIYQNSHFFDQITSFNPYITKKVDVYRGGTSVRYGDRISGVINMQSDDDLFDTFKAGGGMNLLGGDVYFKIPIFKKLGILIAGRRSLTDLYQSFTFNSISSKVFQNSRLDASEDIGIENETPLNYFFSDWNAKLMYKPNENHSYTLSIIKIKNTLNNNNKGVRDNEPFQIGDRLEQNNWGGSFTWLREKEGLTTKKFQLFLSDYSSQYNFEFISENEGASNLIATRINQVTEFGYDLSYDIPIGKYHHVLIGNQLQTTNVSDGVFDIFNVNGQEIFNIIGLVTTQGRTNLIGYLEHRYDADNLFLSTGIRAEYNNLVGLLFEPRVFASLKLSNSLRLTTSLERKNQSFSQINNAQIEPDFYNLLPAANQFWSIQFQGTEGNFEFLTQKSNQLTVGALYKKNGWTAELEGYYKKIDNTTSQIDTFITSVNTIEQQTSLTPGLAKRYGLDFLLKKRIKNYKAWLSYTWAKNTVQYRDFQSLAFPEPFDQRHRFNLSQTYSYNHFEFALGWTYGSGLPFTKTTTGSIQEITDLRANNNVYGNRLPDYHRLDLSTIYHFKNNGRWNGKVGFSIRNLYDRRQDIQTNYSIGIDDQNDFFLQSTTNESLKLTADMVFRISF